MEDRIEARVDGGAINERTKNPGTQKAGAHTGDGDVKSGDERGGSVFAGVVGKNRREEFEVANRDGIEHQRVVLFVVANAIDVAQGFESWRAAGAGAPRCFRSFRGVLAEVMYDGAGCGEGMRMIVE